MTPLEYELHWEKVWNCLMLDCARTLKDDLCIPGDVGRLQESLRGAFEDHYKTNEFNLASGPLMLRLTAQVRSFLDEPKMLLLFAWGDYLSDLVNSRVGEFVWSSTLNGLDEIPHSEWLADRFLPMQSQWAYMTEQLEAKMKLMQLTARDKTIRERLELSEEGLLTHLKLVSRYNIFARLWHRIMASATPSELDEVYATGKELFLKRGIEETQIPYPGMWESGPQRSLLGLESS